MIIIGYEEETGDIRYWIETDGTNDIWWEAD